MNRVGVAEQVMQVAEDFLIGADEKRRQVIRLASERMQVERAADVAAIDELIDLAVLIALDIAEYIAPGRILIEAMDRHDRK